MSDKSPLIQQLLQILDENPDTWGTVLNVSGLRLLEDAIAGQCNINVTSGNQTLPDTEGGPSSDFHARYMILNITGSPGTARTVTIPTAVVPPENLPRTKLYLAYNNTGDSSSVTVQADGGAGVAIPPGEAHWVWCDGTDILEARVKTAAAADLATTATSADQLIGVAGANYARKDVAQMFTAGQGVTATQVFVTGGGPYDLELDMAVGNTFWHQTTQNFTLQAPGSATIGQSFSLLCKQAASGGPHVISFPSNTFIAKGGSFTLSTAANAIDYIAGEYITVPGNAGIFGDRWIISIIKDVTAVS
jgi:hypothetical protein